MFLGKSFPNEYQSLKAVVSEEADTMALGGGAVDEYTWANRL
jgi:hypothetical protein